MRLLVLNCGSATVKYKLFFLLEDAVDVLAEGTVEVEGDHGTAIDKLLRSLPERPEAVAHRVVHGGDVFSEPALIDQAMLEQLKALSDLAPLHNPPALAGIEASAVLRVHQVACFDTMFHQSMPPHAYEYVLPKSITRRHHIRRYGFHGISYHYILNRYMEITGRKAPSIIILHLGNGASVAAIKSGRCVDTSMGVTPLEGLVMGTRAGDLDPGILFFLQRKGMSLDEVERLLWHEAGLLGMTGTRDVRALLERTDEDARLAIEIACYRARKYIGAYLAALGGAEAIVFTGGIGENAPEIRSKILHPLSFLGIEVDEGRNKENRQRITTDASNVDVYVIPTDEELLMAQLARGVVETSVK